MKVILPNPPKGFKAEAEIRAARKNEFFISVDRLLDEPLRAISTHGNASIVLTPDVRKYDWSKTADVAVVKPVLDHIEMWPCQFKSIKNVKGISFQLTDDWLAHFGGPCPFDAESVIVEVITRSGVTSTDLANKYYWKHQGASDIDIIAVRFVSLVEGVEW